MGSTTRYGITYPELSAAPNAPSQMHTMADTIDTALGTAVDNVAGLTAGRTDLIFNGNFRINQEAAASYTASAASGKYTVDGWYVYSGTGATNVITPTAETAGTYADHDRYYLEWDRTVAGSADSYLEHRIEDVRRAGGSSVTIAVLADVASSTASLKVEVVQNFGTGGSPSTAVTTTSTAITLSTSNTSQYVTIAVPSISGKTLGTNEDHYTAIRLTRTSAYGTGKLRLHRIGSTLGTAQVWPDKRPKQQELAIAQRYYWQCGPYSSITGAVLLNGHMWQATVFIGHMTFPVPMRIAPTVTFSANDDFQAASGSVTANSTAMAGSVPTTTGVRIDATVAAGLTLGRGAWLSNSADVTNAAIYVNARL